MLPLGHRTYHHRQEAHEIDLFLKQPYKQTSDNLRTIHFVRAVQIMWARLKDHPAFYTDLAASTT